MASYDPWGKPGGGAPKGNYEDALKKQKFLEEDMRNNRDQSLTNAGGGAPLRDDLGRIQTMVPGDPLLRFQNNVAFPHGRQPIEPIRYKNDKEKEMQYAKDLDQLLNEQNEKRRHQKLQDLKEELEAHQPYGKPGAGAPNYTGGELIML